MKYEKSLEIESLNCLRTTQIEELIHLIATPF